MDFSHPDLQANLWASKGSHGDYVHERSLPRRAVRTTSGTARTWRGRSCAAANNGIGIAGINWKVQLLSLKFLDANGMGFTSVSCFNHATSLQQGVSEGNPRIE